MPLNSYLSIVILNVKGLNVPIKRHMLSEWIKSKTRQYAAQETHHRPEDTPRFKERGWKTIYHANGHQKKAGVAILIPDQLDFKPKTIIRDEEGHDKILKGSVQQEDLTILNIYAPNMGSANYINQLVTKSKKHIDNNAITVGSLKPPSMKWTDHPSKRSARK